MMMRYEVTEKWLRNLVSLCGEAILRMEQLDIDDPGLFGALMEVQAIILDKLEEKYRQ